MGLEFNPENIGAILRGLKNTFSALFQQKFKEVKSQWELVATRAPSDGAANDYGWMEGIPSMRKWVGDKVINRLKELAFSITNDDYEATVAVKRNHLKDNKMQGYPIIVAGLGKSAKKLPDKLVFEVYSRGFELKCMDGQPFFDDDHAIDDGNGGLIFWSNKSDKALSNASQAAAEASFGAAWDKMRLARGADGELLGIRPNILLVPTSLERVAKALMEKDKYADGKPNDFQGFCEVVVADDLTSQTAWFLLCTTEFVKPVIFQDREEATFVAITSPEAPDVFNKAEYIFGVEARCAAGPSLPHLAHGSTGTVKH